MIVFQYIEVACVCIFLIALFMALPMLSVAFKKQEWKECERSEKKARFAILIPARYESGVIENTLKSIFKNDYPTELTDVYVIVESLDDPTVEIAEKYSNVKVYLRKNLSNIGKGYAIDECVRDIFNKKIEYGAFILLDADNLIAPNFLELMNDAYQAGYDVACGKRNNKDWNSSVVSSSSALTFTAINSVINRNKIKNNASILVSGTGFYIRSDVLKGLGGWRFYSLTEDYEFTNFCMCQRLKTCYVDKAVFYDEQPVTLRQSIVQRSRWVKGFFTVKSQYKKEKRKIIKENKRDKKLRRQCLGSAPLLSMAFAAIIYLLVTAGFAIGGAVTGLYDTLPLIIRMLALLAITYAVGVGFTAYLFALEKETIDITPKNKLLTLFYHPFFLMTYVVAFIRSFFVSGKWERIEHQSDKEI